MNYLPLLYHLMKHGGELKKNTMQNLKQVYPVSMNLFSQN